MTSLSILLTTLLIILSAVVITAIKLYLQPYQAVKTKRKFLYLIFFVSVALEITILLSIEIWKKPGTDLNIETQSQIEKLDEIEKSLSDLQNFIDVQRDNLRESELRISELNQQRENLKPVIEADRKVVEALFAAQKERNKREAWLDIFTGISIGIISSLIAAAIYRMIMTRKKEDY